jgi:putative transcriptional regulator
MSTTHHPPQELLLSYAAGTLDEAHAAVVACHLEFCAACRRDVALFEGVGGVLLEMLPVAIEDQPDGAVLAPAMARLERGVFRNDTPRVRRAPDPGDEIIMPRPLALATALRRDTVPWKPFSAGVMCHSLPVFRGKGSLRLLNIGPGAAMHQHSHDEDQLMLVLWGAFVLNGDRFARGDVARIEAGASHQPRADSPEGMICLASFSEPEPFHHHGEGCGHA